MEEVLVAVFKAGELALDFVGEIYQKLRSDSDGDE
jgi:hypothetical protein